jgi:aminomuconate-semialdehyde/2-hydroxymuconate-6-semialdehyde dehydrogenase
MIQIKNYIGGELIEPVHKNYLDNYDPAIGEVYSQVPDADEADVELAVKGSAGSIQWMVEYSCRRKMQDHAEDR